MARAMSATESKKLKDWLAKQADQLNSIGGNLDYDDSHATITLLDARGIEVIHWDLRGVHPNSWSVSPFDANTSKVAIETLELVHEGFL
jgi:phage tail-like protein